MSLGNETAVTAAISWSDPLVITTMALAIATFILAIFTVFILRETKRARIAAQRPIFALEPSQFQMTLGGPLGGDFNRLNLINHGQPATDILARCTWLVSEDSGGSSREFYIVSLAKDAYAGLDIPVREIVQGRLLLRVQINCTDSAGQRFETTITNGFDRTRGTNTLIAYQTTIG